MWERPCQRLAVLAAAVLAAAPATGDDALRAQRAVDHLVSTQQPDGLFRYDFDFLAGAPTGKDNVVRQAGTLFVLGETLLDTGDSHLEPVIRDALDRFEALSLPIGKGGLQSVLESAGVFGIESWRLGLALRDAGLLYDPEGDGLVVGWDDSYESALSGATSLALLSELEYFRATGDDRYRDLRHAWLRGLLTLQVPGEGIRGSPTQTTQGPYVDGEGWLALAYYHDTFPDDQVAAAALAELEDYLLAHYGDAPHRFFYHWGAMSSAARYATSQDARIADFAAAQAEWVLAERPPEDSSPNPTCSLVEGLASAFYVVDSHGGREELAERLRERVAFELARNRAMQIPPGVDELSFAEGVVVTSPHLRANEGAFLAGEYRAYTRNDLTQHCISALLKSLRYGLSDEPPGENG